MNVMQKTTKVVVITPTNENDWLTCYKDEQDIICFSATKSVTCLATRVQNYREITNEEYKAYMARFEVAMAEQENEQPLP